MKNLKRIFSLALAGTMLAGMLTIGASAANFTDAKDIKNDDAVNFMVALNIINGNDDGSFDPERVVSRAEMAKMITIALNGGKEPVLGTKTTPTYTDIKGHWAEKYIEYCSNLGIIAGRGNGLFDPNGTVTGTEAAKMMLVAMGYDSTVFKFTGADWAINVNTEANNATPNKLYKGIETIDPNAGLSRDNAAQLIYNGVQDHVMEKSPSLTITNGEIQYNYTKMDGINSLTEKTILTVRYGYSIGYSYLINTSYNEDRDEYLYNVDEDAAGYGPAVTGDNKLTSSTLKSEEDYSALYGQKVKVVYKDNDVMGIYAANDSKVLAEGVWGNASEADDGKSVKIDGTTYKYDDTVIKKAFNTSATGTIAKEFTFKAIDNDDNGRVDVIVYLPITVAQVTFVGKDSVTIDQGIGNLKLADIDIYDDAKKDDYVTVVAGANTANDVPVVAKLETVEGTVDAVRNNDYRVNGTWYKPATTVTGDSITAGDEVKLALVNGFYADKEKVSGSATLDDVLYVVASDGGNAEITKNFAGKYEGKDTKILLPDGTSQIVKAMRVDATTETDGVSKVDTDLRKTTAAPGLYTYKVNKDGVYELKAVKDSTSAATITGSIYGFTAANIPESTNLGTAAESTSNAEDVFDKSDKKLGTAFIADDAVIYIVSSNGSGSEKVVSGKDLKTMADFGATATFLTKSVSGLTTVQVGVINTANAIGGTNASTGYGYVTTAGYTEKTTDGDWVVKFTAWTEDGEQELTAVDDGLNSTSHTAAQYKRGAFITFTRTSTAGEITDAGVTGTAAAVTGWDGSKYIAFDNAAAVAMKDDNKSVVIYVNTADVAGVDGGSITMANEIATNVYTKNVVVTVTNSEVDVIFVDVANEINNSVAYINKTGVTAADLKAAPEGVYQLNAGSTIDGSTLVSATSDKNDLVFFVFKANSTASEAYTLTVKNGNTTVWVETQNIGDANAHVWYIDASATTYGPATTHIALTDGITYTYTIEKGAETISSGSFNYVAR